LSRRSLSHHLLSSLRVVPKTLGQAEVGQAIDVVSEAVEVKDTSPALPCAVRGLGVSPGILLGSWLCAPTYRATPPMSKGGLCRELSFPFSEAERFGLC
jgi:hypothetical protein